MRLFFSLIMLVVLVSTANAITTTGKIIGVADGDTCTLLVDRWQGKKTHRIRLAEIDAPEIGQPDGRQSKHALAALIAGKTVTLHIEEADKYGRFIGHLFIGDRYINEEMIRQGAAWVYRKYNRNPALLVVEREAKTSHRGLWSLPASQRLPPWEWRRSKTTKKTTQTTAPVLLPPGCGNKRRCQQMTRCSEATHYFKQCGLTYLDGNHDGVPCHAICR